MQSLAYNFWNNKKGQFLSFSDYTASYDPPNLNNAQIFKDHFNNLITNTNFIYENIIPLLKFNGVSFFFIYHLSVQIGIFIVFDNGSSSLPEFEQALSEQALSEQAVSEQALSEQALSEQALSEQAELEQQPSISKKRERSIHKDDDKYQGRSQIKRSRSNPNSIIPESKAFFFQNLKSPSFFQKIKAFFFQNTNTFASLNIFLQKILDSISSTNIILIDFNSISSLQSFTDTLKQSAMHSPFFIPLVPQSTKIDSTNITEIFYHAKDYKENLQSEPAYTTKLFIYTQFFKERFGNSVQNLLATDFVDFKIPRPRKFEKKYKIIIHENNYEFKNKTLASANINTKIFDDNVRYIYAFVGFYYSDNLNAHLFSILIDKFSKTFCTIDSGCRTDTNVILRLVSTLSVELTALLINYSCLDFITELEKYSSGYIFRSSVTYFQSYNGIIEKFYQKNLEYILNYFVGCKELLKNYLSNREQLLILNYNLPLNRKLNLSLDLNNLFKEFINALSQYETTALRQYETTVEHYEFLKNSSYDITYITKKLKKITKTFISLHNLIIKKLDLNVIQKSQEDFSELLKSIKLDEQLVEEIYLGLLLKIQNKSKYEMDRYCVLWTFILLFYFFKLYELNFDAIRYIAENINNLGIGFIIDIYKIFETLILKINNIINNGQQNNINIDIIKTDIVNAIRQVLTLTNYNDLHANTSIFGSDCALIN